MTNNTWFMVKYLAIIIVFLVLLYFASRYLVRVRAVGKKGSIKVVDVLRLGSDSFVYIVEAMNHKYLIAHGKNSIVLLDKVADNEANFERILKEAQLPESPEGCFSDDNEQN